MKVSLSWLKDYVSIDLDPTDLADALTMAGLEVDSVSERYAYLDHVVVGQIEKVRRHPNADKLKICRVNTGDNSLSIVCGAPNVKEGMLAPVAMPGTVFPDGSLLEIGVIRGQTSDGMLCSEAELGLGIEQSGILSLDSSLSIGSRLDSALGLSDTVFEFDLTPNRPDCLSVIGIAREIAAIQNTSLKYPDYTLTDKEPTIGKFTSVRIEAPDHCPRYAARLLENVTVKVSPFWLQDRLLSVGLRPINNIVDITNFVLMETGQPLHAFDFDRLAQNRIVVRTAAKGEKFVTLDQKERILDPEMLMICDGEKAVAIGGVMGGLNSEIEDNTTRVLIESAYFNPVSIRKTSKKLGLSTDASHRFERGVDPEGSKINGGTWRCCTHRGLDR
jgi:phenylalanyl-tRNA synthetase beta chain